MEDEASWIDEEGNENVEQDWVRNYEDEFGNEVEEHTIIVKKPHDEKAESKSRKNRNRDGIRPHKGNDPKRNRNHDNNPNKKTMGAKPEM